MSFINCSGEPRPSIDLVAKPNQNE